MPHSNKAATAALDWLDRFEEALGEELCSAADLLPAGATDADAEALETEAAAVLRSVYDALEQHRLRLAKLA